ncbi:PREDICTED: metastasis suppressor protein 1 isoform X11 [Corvus brachyrhynchos]|uniref:metastasis suppressor protein 1 isoform X11 n=1 Tax=Corvus brachyrhynchos TaxID=85066 RepID=UPI0008167971|nr:PREDICTED: metastasis suppressor protein 1 isoform X11 [Corvus brachyrhynchos]
MEAVIEKECSALGGLFQTIISDMKGSYPVWEDFINKAGKLQSQLRTTVVAAAAFLDAFQKVADMATNTRGGTREIGSALTRMCMRHRSIESKLRQFSSALIDCLINPLQEQMEEWKKVANQLDKDHAKEYKKARQEIKKKSSDTLKLQKKAKKAEALGRGDIQPQLDSALQDVNDKYLLLEETEKQAVRKALIEERGRFCAFISMLRPVIEEEISMLGEITHLQTISDDLKSLTMDPHKLPSSSEQNSSSSASSEASETCQSVSECSSPTSVSSGSTMGAWASTDKLSNGFYHCSLSSDPSVASVGAGPFPHFPPVSRAWTRAPSALLPDYVHYYTIGPGMLPSSKIPSWKDWAKPGPYDQPMVNTLQRRKEKCEPDLNGAAQSGPPAPPEDTQRPRSMTVSAATRQGEEMEACEELALALSRGLQLDTQRSSRDSLQCSSGYSTQTTTPCCSEDTIPSQVSDYDYFSVSGDQEAEQQEFDKSSTIPRNSDISQSYRRMFQTKRPASTAGLPTTLGPVIVTPGVATIRRTPSTKPSVRRGTIGGGPIPIKTPVIPVKTPTVPDIPGGLPGALAGTEECPEQNPESPAAGDGGQGVTSMPSWSGQASVNPPAPGQKLGAAEEQRQAGPESEGEESERDGVGSLAPAGQGELEPSELSPGDVPQGEDMLNAIRRGVKLKKTTTNDRSAPRIS